MSSTTCKLGGSGYGIVFHQMYITPFARKWTNPVRTISGKKGAPLFTPINGHTLSPSIPPLSPWIMSEFFLAKGVPLKTPTHTHTHTRIGSILLMARVSGAISSPFGRQALVSLSLTSHFLSSSSSSSSTTSYFSFPSKKVTIFLSDVLPDMFKSSKKKVFIFIFDRSNQKGV